MNTHRRQPRPRRGSVLYVVLVIVALMTLAGYQFAEVMLTESAATNMYGRRVKVRAFADSGIEVAAAKLGERQLVNSTNAAEVNLFHNPGMFGGVMLDGSVDGPARWRGRFSVVSPLESDAESRTIRFGLADESGKLNINVLPKITGNDEEGWEKANFILLQIPGMTVDIADAIMDFIDEDEDERLYGAESNYYEPFGYFCKNGPLESLDELLLIRGVTPQLVFGFDANRNGVIDPSEAQAAAEFPDMHPLGWSAFLTVHSKEWNRKLDGTEKINLNNGVLADLYDQIVEEFANDGNGEEIAKFIVAYRMNGPTNAGEDNEPASAGLSSANTSTGGGNSSGNSGGATLNEEGVKQLAQSAGRVIASSGGNAEEAVTRGGMNLAAGAKVNINSIYDLIDAETEAEVNGATSKISSPWTSDNMVEKLPNILNRLTTVSGAYIEGRVNVNQARQEVLTAIISTVPGFDEDINLARDLAQKIAANKMVDSNGAPLNNVIATRASTAWLITENYVTLQQMRELDRYLTTRGDVFRAQVLGYFDEGGPMVRLETLIDATQKPPRVVFLRDLTELGKGFSATQLMPATN